MDQIRIVIAERDQSFRKNLREMLTMAGYQVIGEAEDGITALKMVRSLQPDIVLAAANLPALNGLELTRIIEESRLAAFVLMVDYGDKDRFYKPGERTSIPIIIKPFDDVYLYSILQYSYAAFCKMADLESDIRRLKEDLETRKLIEKAKGVLMKARGISEEEAFKKIQHQSMNKRTTMKKIAEAIITAHEVSNI